jgi:OPT family oligopeptide transporter
MPVSVGIPFDNTGAQYNLSAVVNKNAFDQAKYEEYSPMFLPITYTVSYGAIFAIYPAALVHIFLWYRKDIIHQSRRGLKDQKDIHSQLMSKYPEVPHWWFLTLGIVSLVMGIIAIEVCDTKLPVWAFFFSIIFSIVFIIPFGILQAVTNQTFSPFVLAEMFFGYVLPGRPLALMVFKILGGNTGLEAILYSGDQKFAHYMKIPPRLLFSAQVISTIISIISGIAAQRWAMGNIPDICSPHQKDGFTCPNINIYNTATIIWGGIGPKRIFSPGAL